MLKDVIVIALAISFFISISRADEGLCQSSYAFEDPCLSRGDYLESVLLFTPKESLKNLKLARAKSSDVKRLLNNMIETQDAFEKADRMACYSVYKTKYHSSKFAFKFNYQDYSEFIKDRFSWEESLGNAYNAIDKTQDFCGKNGERMWGDDWRAIHFPQHAKLIQEAREKTLLFLRNLDYYYERVESCVKYREKIKIK